jgi:murein DD-endopeptidase MepM/ murein hydrolase activator NlpD
MNTWKALGTDYQTKGVWLGEISYTKKKLYAPFNGIVKVNWGPTGGWWIKLYRGNGDVIEMAHNTKAYVASGTKVYAGKLIGITGNTGSFDGKNVYGGTLKPGQKANKPYIHHLHIQIVGKDGRRKCPETYKWR